MRSDFFLDVLEEYYPDEAPACNRDGMGPVRGTL